MLWQNLIGNAIKFRAPDRPPAVRITVPPGPGDLCQFCVTDNGIGIAPEFAEKVFVIFQRLHRREAYPGNGIGLALCKQIVEQHGGQISIDTAHAGGTRICLTLPVAGQPADASAADDGAADDGAGTANDRGADSAAAAAAGGEPAATAGISASSPEGIPA